MQPSQHVDDRGPVAVIDRVVETTGRGVEVREQGQGMPAVQRADDLTSGTDDPLYEVTAELTLGYRLDQVPRKSLAQQSFKGEFLNLALKLL